jgi:hypothetical protein
MGPSEYLLSPRSRNEVMVQDSLGGVPAVATNQNVVPAMSWIQKQRKQADATFEANASISPTVWEDNPVQILSGLFTGLFARLFEPQEVPSDPEVAFQAEATLEPEPETLDYVSPVVYLPVVIKQAFDMDYFVVTPQGRSLNFPSGRETITFVDGGLPTTLQVRFASGVQTDRPLNLYPFGGTFAIEGRWQDNGAIATVLDRHARPQRELGAAKPSPAEYRYHATLTVQLSEQEQAFVSPDRLSIARLDARSGKWNLLPVKYDPVTGIVSAQTSHLGTFALVQNMPSFPTRDHVIVTAPSYRTHNSQSAAQSLLEVIVDDLDKAFQRFQDPRVPGGPFWFDVEDCVVYEDHAYWTWNRSSYEDPWLPPGEPCNWATWTPPLTEPGYYTICLVK